MYPFWGVGKGTGATDEATVPPPGYPLCILGICGTEKTLQTPKVSQEAASWLLAAWCEISLFFFPENTFPVLQRCWG